MKRIHHSTFFAVHLDCGLTDYNDEIEFVLPREWQAVPVERRCEDCERVTR